MTYNSLIHREQGGSVLNIGSGAIGRVQSGGCQVVDAGGLLTIAEGGSVTFNSTVSGTAFRLAGQGASTPSVGWGPNVPTHSAPMGSIYIRANGSISGFYINITQDANGSTWRLHQQGSAIG
jgi:hypothetical protein